LSRADRATGKIRDGERTEFRCFSASQEVNYSTVRASRWHNLEALKGKTTEQMAALILAALPRKATTVRIHVSGDFFSLAYLDAWWLVARMRPDLVFYFYTKSLRYWLARLDLIGDGHTPGTIPNVVPTASRGGRDDALIDAHGLRSAVVVFSEQEAAGKGLSL